MIVVRILMVIACAMFSVNVAFAGNETDEKVECFPGSYVVGFKGRAKAWLYNVNVICAKWDARHERLNAPGPAAGGLIGRSEEDVAHIEEQCPAGSAVFRFHVSYAVSDVGDLVHHIDFDCKPVGIEGQIVSRKFGSTENSELAMPPPRKSCIDGHLVTGIQGRGHWVEALDLLCSRGPSVIISTGPRGPYERHPDPVLRGKPAGGFGNAIDPTQPTQRIATAKNDVDIYQGPGEGDVLDILRKDETGIILTQQDGWVKLYIAKLAQKEGWVAADHLTLPP